MTKRKAKSAGDWKIRTPAPLHSKLKAAAERKGVSLNAETVERLERSFDFADIGGPQLDRLLKTVATVMAQAGEKGAFWAHRKVAKEGAWMDDPYAYDCALKAAVAVLERFRPPGDVIVPAVATPARIVGSMSQEEAARLEETMLRDLGPMMADYIMRKEREK